MTPPSEPSDEPSRPGPWSLRTYGTYKSVPALTWDDVPPLAVVTGPNGSGKSQLLEAIGTGLTRRLEIQDLLASREQISQIMGNAELRLHSLEQSLQTSLDRETRARQEAEQRQYRLTANGYRQQVDSLRLQIDRAHYAEIVVPPADGDFGPDDVALVADAYQGSVSRPLSPSQAAGLLEHIGPRGFRHTDDRARRATGSTQPLTAEEFSASPGRAVDVAQPLDGLGLAIQAYRAEKFHRFEAAERGEPTDPLPTPPWDVVNALLGEAGFPLRVAAPTGRVGEAQPVQFVSKGHTVNVEDLSSGERTLVGLASSLYAGRNGARLPRLLLLDEPDAHLHPALTAQVLTALYDVLVCRLGVRIVLTTHSPSTVALAPDDAVFAIVDGRVQKVDKWAAVSALTAGIVTVGPRTRFVFVEDHDDVAFYSAVVGALERLDATFPKGRLVFLPANKDVTDGRGSGGRDRVVQWAADLGTPSVAGLIDYDTGPTGDDPPRVWRIGRYAVENYLLDPLLLASYASRTKALVLPGFEPFSGREKDVLGAPAAELQPVIDHVTARLAGAMPSPPTDTTPVPVEYVSGPCVRLPQWLLRGRGKDIQGAVQGALGFPFHVAPLTKTLPLVPLVPTELADTLRRIATS